MSETFGDTVHICMVLYANNDKELFYKAESTKEVNQHISPQKHWTRARVR